MLEEIYKNEIYKHPKREYKKAEIQQFHKILENIILELNDSYYNHAKSLIEDREYDDLLKLYEDLCKRYKIANKITVGASNSRTKTKHLTSMLSLSNSYNIEDIQQFLNRFKDIKSYHCELKIDGVSFNLIYEKGELKEALTRGDGEFGEKIMHNLPEGVPRSIDLNLITGITDNKIEFRGEIFLNIDEFKKLQEAGEEFINPRNTISGAIRTLKGSSIKSNYVIYGSPNLLTKGQDSNIAIFKRLGFKVNEHSKTCKSLNEIQDYYNKIKEMRESLNYEIDGIVIKINNLEKAYKLEHNARYVKHSIAYKFPAIAAKTKILDIYCQIGRTGVLTPVAKVSPVYVSGVTIKKVTLHNIDFIFNNDIQIGDLILLERAGDVIPKVKKVLIEERVKSKRYIPPLHCPSCDAAITTNYRCPNKASCKDQQLEYMKYFAQVLKIRNLGPQILKTLIDNKTISNVIDILNLKQEDLVGLNNCGKIYASKLITSINKNKYMPLSRFIQALGIEEIGLSGAKIIAKKIQTTSNLKNISNIDFSSEKHTGAKINNNIQIFFKQNKQFIFQLLDNVYIEEDTKECPSVLTFLQNKKIGISGSFERGKEFIISTLQQYGILVKKTFSSNFDFLILGKNSGEKVKIARKFSIDIITEANILNIIKKI